MEIDAFLELSKELENELRGVIQSAEEASKKLHSLADEIDEHFKKCNRAKIVESAASLVGFPLMAVGFGLSFVSFGASLGLSIAGAAISGAGGITAAGSGLAEHFITKAKCKTAQEAVDDVRKKAEEYQDALKNMEQDVLFPVSSLPPKHTGSFATNVASGVGIPVLNGIRLAAGVADDAAATVFRGLGTGLRVAYIGGFVVSALLVPYDIYTLASSSVKEHRKTGSAEANKIRELAKEMHRSAQEAKSLLVETHP